LAGIAAGSISLIAFGLDSGVFEAVRTWRAELLEDTCCA
jgi:hypothetical protein